MGCNCKNKKRTVWTRREAQRRIEGGTFEPEPVVASGETETPPQDGTQPYEAS